MAYFIRTYDPEFGFCTDLYDEDVWLMKMDELREAGKWFLAWVDEL